MAKNSLLSPFLAISIWLLVWKKTCRNVKFSPYRLFYKLYRLKISEMKKQLCKEAKKRINVVVQSLHNVITYPSFFILTFLHAFFFTFKTSNRLSLKNYLYGKNFTFRPACLCEKLWWRKTMNSKKGSIFAPESPFFSQRLVF